MKPFKPGTRFRTPSNTIYTVKQIAYETTYGIEDYGPYIYIVSYNMTYSHNYIRDYLIPVSIFTRIPS